MNQDIDDLVLKVPPGASEEDGETIRHANMLLDALRYFYRNDVTVNITPKEVGCGFTARFKNVSKSSKIPEVVKSARNFSSSPPS